MSENQPLLCSQIQVTALDPQPESTQLDLFADDPEKQLQDKMLHKAMDSINQRYGEFTLSGPPAQSFRYAQRDRAGMEAGRTPADDINTWSYGLFANDPVVRHINLTQRSQRREERRGFYSPLMNANVFVCHLPSTSSGQAAAEIPLRACNALYPGLSHSLHGQV